MPSAIPSFGVQRENKAKITISLSDASLVDQGYTYNQAGLTFNQAGVDYGGVTNANQDILPILDRAIQIISTMKIPQTQTTFIDQGYTYNQSGFTFNQAGVDYGGMVNQNYDIFPAISVAKQITPHMENIIDIYTTINPNTPSRNGPGFFMFLNLT